MKKIFKFLMLSLIGSTITLSGCGEKHVHTYDTTKWETNKTQHWHAANCGHDLAIDIADHLDLDNDGYCDECGYLVSEIDKKEFENLVFKSKSFVYDGQVHSLEVENVPDFATVEYSNNYKVEIGTYGVTARVSAPGYYTQTLSASLSITGKQFEGLTFSNLTVNYDGEEHSLKVENVPDFASVSYSNNNKVNVGSYRVTATVTADGYETKTLTATLTIKGQDFEGIVFRDQTVGYDGYSKSIYCENVPDFATVKYSGNGKSAVGTYTVTATITAAGYNTLVLTAKMTISNLKAFPDYNFKDLTFIYDGKPFNFQETLDYFEDGITSSATATYKLDGKKVTKCEVTALGVHTFSATYSAENYADKTYSFKINVISDPGGVDSAKTAYQLSENEKYNDLFTQIKKGNYSVDINYFDEFDDDWDGIFERVVPGFTENVYCTNDAYFSYSRDDGNYGGYYIHVGVKSSKYSYINDYSDGECTSTGKFLSVDFLETAMSSTRGLTLFGNLSEDTDGTFADGVMGGYRNTTGTFAIDVVNNTFTLWQRTFYYHQDEGYPNHNEMTQYVFYNIGNTTLSIPQELAISDKTGNSYTFGGFTRNGIYYASTINDGVDCLIANVTMNETTSAYLGGGGEFVLEAAVDGVPVKEITYNYYAKYYYVDRSKFTIKVYYDDSGYYQGEYESYGFVKYYNDVKYFGTNILYYDDWH